MNIISFANEILQHLILRWQQIFHRLDHVPTVAIFVTQILTRDLFAVADLFVI